MKHAKYTTHTKGIKNITSYTSYTRKCYNPYRNLCKKNVNENQI